MNKTKASRSPSGVIAITAALILSSRAAFVLLFSFLAYLGNDPDARIPLLSVLCRIFCELACGFLVGRALEKDFSQITRALIAALASLVLCAVETLIGRAMSGGTVSVLLFVTAVMSSAAGGWLSARRKSVKPRKRKKKR